MKKDSILLNLPNESTEPSEQTLRAPNDSMPLKKNSKQIQAFLESNSYRTRIDWEMILLFARKYAGQSFRVNFEINPEDGITASDFAQWLEGGFSSGDIVDWNGKPAIIGISHFKTPTIAYYLSDDKLSSSNIKTPSGGLKMASTSMSEIFKAAMLKEHLQFNWESLTLTKRYIPKINQRVIFHGNDIEGLGVVRKVDIKTAEVELYCYYIYDTGQIGFSMHEKGIVNLNDFSFEPMDNSQDRQTDKNGIACQRRLNRELNRFGKTWNERMHRIEPVKMMAEIGSPYWYINDKLMVTKGLEKGSFVCRQRYNAGNYFLDESEALTVLMELKELIRDRLAL